MNKFTAEEVRAVVDAIEFRNAPFSALAADMLHAYADTLSQPASPAGMPDGMVLVPWEPEPGMLAIYEHIRSGSDWQAHVFRLTKRQMNRHRAAYKAMIAAAPSVPEGDNHE